MSRRILSVAILTLAGSVISASASAFAPPNILVVILDDVGVDQLNRYGEASACSGNGERCFADSDCPGMQSCLSDYPLTPTIDRIADAGVLFRNAYASATCKPARAAALSGRYGVRTGTLSNNDSFPPSERTIPEALRDPTIVSEVYQTAAFGKWGVGPTPSPLTQGFNHFAGHLGSGLGADYFNWQRTVGNVTSTCGVGSPACPDESYATTVNVNDALEWIVGRSDPWFAWLSFNAPHTPFHVPPHDLLSSETLARMPTEMGSPAPAGTPCVGGFSRECYRAAIEAADAELAELLDAVPENTWIFLLGDNGTPTRATSVPFDPAHSKGSVYEGGVNIPLIVQAPDSRNAGQESEAFVHIADLFTTALKLARGELPTDRRIDGLSLLPMVDDPAANPRLAGYADFADRRVARDERYKLIRLVSGDEFYDLLDDPFEQTELLAIGLDSNAMEAYQSLSAEIEGVDIPAGREPGLLRLGKSAGAVLSLEWSASCDPDDDDYGIYSGNLGEFDSHQIVQCGTAGAASVEILPLSGARYYLVVPGDGVREGSYGSASSGLPRLPTDSQCLPRSFAGCG